MGELEEWLSKLDMLVRRHWRAIAVVFAFLLLLAVASPRAGLLLLALAALVGGTILLIGLFVAAVILAIVAGVYIALRLLKAVFGR
jgi:hypothetical protein